jgi:predicted regulator of amino acid metabolism with ACT domain
MNGVAQLVDRFAKAAPVAVMVRGALDQILSDKKLDAVFENHASRQYVRKLAFAACFWLMVDVVTKAKPSIHAGYEDAKEDFDVTIQSVYNKLNRLELRVLENLVSKTADDMIACAKAMKVQPPKLVPGYVCRLLDGNILAGTEHRIKELRRTNAAALPGRSVCFYNYQYRMIDDVVLDKNGHAQDKSQIDSLLERVNPGDCIIADAGFCTQKMMLGISQQQAYFILRKPSNTAVELVGKRKRIGKSETGILFEQDGILHCKNKKSINLRVITLERFEPTESGKMEIVFLTNLPKKVTAICVAQAYRRRWRIENTFQDLAQVVESEVSTLGYPSAALFGFVVGCVIQNVIALTEHALQKASQKQPARKSNSTSSTNASSACKEKRLSRYKIALEIKTVTPGMEIAVTPAHWTKEIGTMTPPELAQWMLSIAKHAKLADYETYRWSPKQEQPKRASGNRGNHLATAEIIDKRKKKNSSKHL